ncbi:MAG: hypothetical protein P8N52_09405 [Crocinitomicaceae bacterium]|nr:hypothetical protein [Crocinitomicaceae bacterium]MDG1776569.1 hypothetical protein [Crocinitomicaceae bacterium]
MKNLLFYIAFIFLCSIFVQPTFASEKKSSKQALSDLEKIVSNEPNNTSAYYNLGLTYLESNSFGKAIWAFEKVLNRIPNDSETIDQIEYAYRELNNDLNYTPRLNAFTSGLYSISSNRWSIVAIISSVLISICIVLYKLNDADQFRKFILVVCFLITLLFSSSILLAAFTKEYQTEVNFGVAIKKNVQTYDIDSLITPKVLLEGERVKLLKETISKPPHLTNFIRVESMDKEIVFVRLEDIAFI